MGSISSAPVIINLLDEKKNTAKENKHKLFSALARILGYKYTCFNALTSECRKSHNMNTIYTLQKRVKVQIFGNYSNKLNYLH